jgi:hypothetical protein
MKNDTYRNRKPAYKRPKKRSRFSAFLRFVLLMVLVFFAGFFTFYAIDNNLFSRQIGQTGPIENGPAAELQAGTQAVPEVHADAEEEEGLFFADLFTRIKEAFTGEQEQEVYPKNIRMDFYFAVLGEGYNLGAEARTIAAGSPQNAAISAMKELLKGPNSNFYFSVIPPGTSLLGVEIYENFIRVDLSQEFLSNSLDTRVLDELIIYSMVNTLTQIPGIDGVLFLIEGKSIKEYGNIDLSLPLIKNEAYFFES